MKTGIQYHLSFFLSNTMELRFSKSQRKNVIRVTEIGREKIIREKYATAGSLRARFSMGLPNCVCSL